MNPDHHRAPAARAGGKDIKVEAILGDAGDAKERCGLRTMVGERRRIERTNPGRGRLGRCPTEVSHRRRGIGDAKKLVNAMYNCSLDGPLSVITTLESAIALTAEPAIAAQTTNRPKRVLDKRGRLAARMMALCVFIIMSSMIARCIGCLPASIVACSWQSPPILFCDDSKGTEVFCQ